MSVLQDRQGPDWPLGTIVVVTPGVPVSIMSLVDPTGKNDPATPTGSGVAEYTPRFNQILFQAFQANMGGNNATGMTYNVGLCYVVRKGGSRADPGTIVAILTPGASWLLPAAALNMNVLSPYRYEIDADSAGDAVQVTGFVG
jgi:hypothetical protein